MARSAVLSADTRCMRAAPLARSLPLPICRLRASPCRAEGAKGATLPNAVCCAYRHVAETNQMLRHSLPEAARARLRPSVGLLSRNAIGGAVPAKPGVRSGRRQGHRLVCPNRKVKTNHPDILAVPANSGDRSGRRRGRLFLSPNRKVKTPIAFGVAVPANPDTRSARRRGHRRVWPNRKIKTESPLRLDEYGSGVAVAGVAPKRRSLPALCTAAASVFPRPPSRLQSPTGAAFRGRPVGRFTPAPVRPAGAPSTPPGRA